MPGVPARGLAISGGMRRIGLILMLIALTALAAQLVFRSGPANVKHSFQGPSPSFMNDLQNGRVKSVVVDTKNQKLQVTQTAAGGGVKYAITYPDATLLAQLVAKDPELVVSAKSGSSSWTGLLTLLLPVVLIIGFMIFIMRRMQGGDSKVMGFGKSPAKQVSVDSPKVTFKDVAGIDETVEELEEIKEFLDRREPLVAPLTNLLLCPQPIRYWPGKAESASAIGERLART
jgi:cell division protease FtsH